MSVKQQIDDLKTMHREKMDKCSEESKAYVDKHGVSSCDYLEQRQLIGLYHRGAWNALNDIKL